MKTAVVELTKRIAIVLIALMVLATGFSPALGAPLQQQDGSSDHPVRPAPKDRHSPWFATIALSADDQRDLFDYVAFGEKSDADDGRDVYDIPKPGMPPAPFIYAWFDAGLSAPYNRLWQDIRLYPDTAKTWDLNVAYDGDQTVTLSLAWIPGNITASEYTSIVLNDLDGLTSTDMLLQASYEYQADPATTRHFQIVCTTTPTTHHYMLPLSSYWNLITPPFNMTIPTENLVVNYLGTNHSWLQAVADGYLLNTLYEWNGAYDTSTALHAGKATWLYAFHDCILWLPNVITNTDQTITGLITEWNMMGAPFEYGITTNNITVLCDGDDYSWSDAVLQGIMYPYLYRWDAFSQAYEITTSFSTGQGVWMYAYDACILTLLPPTEDYTLTVTILGEGTITLTPSQPTYHIGDVVQLEASEDVGWIFDHWEEDLTGNNNPASLTITRDMTITATFIELPPLQITSDFDSASIDTYTITDNTVDLTLKTETIVNSGAHYTYWTNFKVHNTLHQNVTFHITNANLVPFLTSTLHEAQLVYSYDGITWNRLTNHTYDAGTYTFYQNFTSNHVQIATFFPFNYTTLQSYLDIIDTSPWATKTILGQSTQSRDINLITITNSSIGNASKKKVYIISRQHAAETPGTHMLKGLIDFLTSTDADAARLRDSFIWYIVPMVNPDGVFLGNSRATSLLRDPNDDWSNTESIETTIVKNHLTTTKNTVGVDFFIDLHGQMSEVGWKNYIYSPPGNTFFPLLSQWTDFDDQSSPGVGSSSARGYATSLGIFTFTFEPSPHLKNWTISSLNEQGKLIAFAIDEYYPLFVDSDFNASTSSEDFRANATDRDWYESRNNDPLLVSLDTNNIQGNTGKKAGFFSDDITHYTYLSQELRTRQSGRFSVSYDAYVDTISIYNDSVSNEAYNRTGSLFIGSDDEDKINGPCTTSNERLVFLAFYDKTPSSSGNDIELKAREYVNQSWYRTNEWTTIATNLSYDTWYKIRLDINVQTRTYDVYLNDVLVGTNIHGYNRYNSSSVNAISFYAGGTSRGTFYIDNVFAPRNIRHQITVSTEGNGIVTTTPGESTYRHNQSIQLTAIPEPGWSFDHWTGSITGTTNPTTITITSDMTVTGVFTRDEYTFTTLLDGNGLITLAPPQPTYHYDDIVEVQAAADSGWTFTHWSGDLTGHTSPVSLKILHHTSVTAHFSTTAIYTLSTTTLGSGMVTNDPDRAIYEPGATVSLTATGNPGWTFTAWTGDVPTGHEHDNPLTITMDANKALAASFTSSMPHVHTYPITDVTSTSATLWGNISDTGGEACSVWFEWNDYDVEECMGTIATGVVCKDGRSILQKNRHYYYDNVKPYYYQGTNYSYFGIGDAVGQCRMGQNEIGLAIVNMDVGGTILNWKYQTDWGSGSQDNDAKFCLGNFSTVRDTAMYLALHGYYYGNGSTNGQYLIISSEPGVGAIVAIDHVGHTNITWINNTYAGCANSWYCDHKWDTGDYNDRRAKQILDDIVLNGTSSDGDHLLNWKDVAQRVAKDASDLQNSWAFTSLDTTNDRGLYTSMVLNASGRAMICYHDETSGDLRYTKYTGSSWSTTTVDSTGHVGEYTSIRVDSSGNPHISYFDSTNGDLKYAKWTGSAWAKATVDSVGIVGSWTSLALDASNNPAISYHDDTNGDLKYARWTGSSWAIETVDSNGDVGDYTSLALDASGNACISYYDATNGDLKYAYWTGSVWVLEIVDSAGDVGKWTSISLDSTNRPHISYCDWTGYDLKYARWTGSTWVTETVDSTGDVGSWTSLVLDSSNRPTIGYYDATAYDMKIANWTDTAWTKTAIHTFPKDGQYLSIALDSYSRLQISFYDETNKDMRYAKWIASYSYSGQIATSYSRSSTVHVAGNSSLNGSIHMSWLGIGQTTQISIFLPLYAGNLHALSDIPSNFTTGNGIQPYANVKRNYARGNLPDGNFYCARVREILNYTAYNEDITFKAFDNLMDTIMYSADEQEARARLDGFMETTLPRALSGYIANSTTSSTETYKHFPQGIGNYSETINGLRPGTIYYVKAWANNTGSEANGTVRIFMTRPQTPTNAHAYDYNSAQTNLSWTKGAGAHYTIIERNATSASTWQRGAGIQIYNGTGTHTIDSSIQPGVNYYYRLWSYTTEKGLDQYSSDSILTFTGESQPPQFYSLSPSDGATNIPINLTYLNVTMIDSEGDPISWTIQTSPDVGSSSGTLEANGTKSCSISGLIYRMTYTWYVNATDGNSWNNQTYTFATKAGLLVDPDFNASTNDADLRNNSILQDWYESRAAFPSGADPTLLTLDTANIGGNTGKKAALKDYGTTGKNAYLTQEFGAPLSSDVSVTFDINIDKIEDNANYDRSGHVYIGDDRINTNCPTGTANERFVYMTFYDPSPGDTGNDMELRVRTTSGQSGTTTSQWTLLASGLSYDTWYNIQLLVFPVTGKFNVYLDGILVGNQISKYSGYTPSIISFISFSADSDGRGDFYVDNVIATPFNNAAPALTNENPTDGTTGVSLTTSQLSVQINDADSPRIWYAIHTAPDIGSISMLTGPGELGGTKTCPVSGLNYATIYYWYVNATDGFVWTNRTYHFTSENAPTNPPVISNPSLADGTHGVPTTLSSLSITIQDPDLDLMDWTIQTTPNIGSSSGTGQPDGTISCSVSGLAMDTLYTWYVNVTDGLSWTRRQYSFLSQDGILSDPDFEDSSTSADIRFNLFGLQDWYESRNQDQTLLTLDTMDVGGNTGKKAAMKGTGSNTAYLSQEFAPIQTGCFNVTAQVYIDKIPDNGDYDRTCHIIIGDDSGGTNGPCSTNSERYACLAFYDSTPGDTGDDLILVARNGSQTWGTTSAWTQVMTGLSYDTWYTIKILVNFTASSYNVSVNDVHKAWVNKCTEFVSTSLTHISFFVGGNSRGEFYVDNVSSP